MWRSECRNRGMARVDELQAGDPGQIGPFTLLGRLGESGMGRVYLGTSPSGGKVAIKVVHPHHASDPEFRRRFAREAAAAREVEGVRIAAVVGADPDADPPWMATAYIAGPSLADAVARQGPLNEARMRALGAALAEGLAAIHQSGLIHGDLKPGNVILGDDGPRITDFGMAKGADVAALNGSNTDTGTLRHMAPEQLQGHEPTARSDVFALGTILAYAATGHDAFGAPTIPALITGTLNDPPDLDPLTGDLRDIISACLAKDPGDRPSPADLLARFDPPDTVSDPGPRTTPEPAPLPADHVGPQRRRRGRRMVLTAAGTAAAVGLATALTIPQLGNHPARTPAARTPMATLTSPSGAAVNSVAFGPAGTLAVGDYNGNTCLWNTATGKITAVLANPGDRQRNLVNSVAFAAGGTLASGDANGSTYLWDTATGKITASLTDLPSAGISSVASGPGGSFAASDGNGSTYLWNTATGKVTATLNAPSDGAGGVQSIAFGPDGTLATGDVNGSTYLWSTTTGKITATLTDPGTYNVTSVAFGSGGIFAASDGDGNTYLWNTTTGTINATLTDPGSQGVSSIAFGPDGTLAAGDLNGSTYLWNTAAGTITATVTDPRSKGVASVAFGPGGILATGDNSGSTYLWKIS
jgi:serine/threonine protein kinase